MKKIWFDLKKKEDRKEDSAHQLDAPFPFIIRLVIALDVHIGVHGGILTGCGLLVKSCSLFITCVAGPPEI